ncbi:MAG: hypothetical protein ACRDQZ_09245 [Mycobacteriales bacterium]
MDHCLMCGQPIETADVLIAIEKHAPPGQKGCSVEFRWVRADSFGDAPAFGSADCALTYFQRWMSAHMKPSAARRGRIDETLQNVPRETFSRNGGAQ